MKTQGGAQRRTSKEPPVITTITLQKYDDGSFCLTISHRRGRRTMAVGTRLFRLDHDARLPAEVEVWLWGQVQAPSLALAGWQEQVLF